MQTLKETAASVAGATKSVMEKKDSSTERTSDDEKSAADKPGEAAGGTYSYSATTGEKGQSTGGHQMSALPGHGTGEPAGQVVEGTVQSHPIGRGTGTGRTTTVHNTHVGPTAGQGYGTGGGYSG